MKIVYLTAGLCSIAGIERVLNNKTNWLAGHGYEVAIVTTDQDGRPMSFDFDPRVEIVDLGLNFHHVENLHDPLRKKVSFMRKRQQYRDGVKKYLKENPADVVISTFGLRTAWLPSLKDDSRKMVELHFSRYSPRQGWLRDFLRRNNFKRYDRFIVLTHEDKLLWGNMPNIKVIPNATSFEPVGVAPLDNKQVIAVGRLAPQKGFDLLIETWRQVHHKHPDWKLVIYGGHSEGDTEQRLRKQIERAGLGDVVTIYPPTQDIAEKYKESAFYVLSSRYEGFPMVLLETMSQGVPAVAMACKCGPRDMITPEVDGLLVDDGDVEGLTAGINRLIEDEALRKQMGLNAMNTIKKRFTEDVVMEQWVKLFESRR